ncbi:MAG TPA: LAGLIDADG family homing endonuclease [Ktedonobacterales bacterium]|jgi:predicted Ser/Thr protein kinase
MDLVKRLGEYRDRERELAWEGTFAQYFEIATKQPSIAQLSHERIYNMMMAAGVETTRSGDPRYKFFGQDIFGLDKPLQQIVEYFHSAAQRLEVRKRILLLMGPVGGGKSTIVYLLKRGLEQYTRSQEGATYAIKECPMHEEPLHLIPLELREEVEREFGLYIEGDLCPACRWMLEDKYGGKIEEIPVKRISFSEKNRNGIGTFTPSDPKCVTGDTLVLTDEGLRSMEDIYLSLEHKPREDEFVPFETTVLGVNGPEQSAKFYCGGFQPIYEVETNLGYTIRGTANHPLLTLLPGGETAWKKIGELQPGDYVALARGSRVFGQSTTLPESFYPLPADLQAIPACVLAGSEADILIFLEELFKSNVTIRDNRAGSHMLEYTCKSRKLVRQLQAVLLNLGIISGLLCCEDNGEPHYKLVLRSDQMLDLMTLLPPLLQMAPGTLRDTRPSSQRAQTVLATQPALAATTLATKVQQQYLWATVYEVRQAGIELVYDLLVPGTHSFVADGFVQHNSQDISELVGGIDLSTIGEVGVESDPRAYRFDGELNIANRGVAEFVEMLKVDEKFLYVLLTLSQEQNIKTGRFSMIYADEVVISHTNESEYQAFVGNRKSEALQDRIILVKVPYNLRVSDEMKIYDKLLKQSSLQGVHIAPNTLRIASTFAVLTRLEPSKKAGMSLMKKLKLYEGEDLEDFKQKDIKELQEEAQREGMDGISPRYVINRLSSALVRENTTCINPIDALRALRDGMDQHTGLSREQRERYLNFISEARKEFDQLAQKEVQRAFVYSYEESARTLLNNYLDNVEAYCNKTKVRDPITDEDMEPDEQLMRSIEEQIGISDNAKKAFREEILIRISSLARRGQTFDYTSHERLKEAIEKKLFADLRDVVKITTSSRTPDAEQLKKINEVVNRLIKEHGYCHVCANELLKYAGSLLNR